MAQKLIGLSHDLIIHPGETLLEIIETKKMSQAELSVRTGHSQKHISKVVNGTAPISASFAQALEYVLGIDSSFWLNLQAQYDDQIQEYESQNNITENEMEITKKLRKVAEYFLKQCNIPYQKDIPSLTLSLRKCLSVSNLTAIPELAIRTRLRTTSNHIDIYVLYTWLKLCENLLGNINIENELNTVALLDGLSFVKSKMFDSNINTAIAELTDFFAKCGIIFKVVKHFPGAPVQGFIKKNENGKMLLFMTIRNKSADIFWFSLFHEIAHILNGDVEGDLIDYTGTEDNKEELADKFAANALLNPKDYESFIDDNCFLNYESIRDFAKSQNVPPYIVIGRLQKEKRIPYSQFSNHKTKYEWVEK